VVLHAYAVADVSCAVLATPDSATGVSRMMQALGRRYAAGFNRRHGRSGSLVGRALPLGPDRVRPAGPAGAARRGPPVARRRRSAARHGRCGACDPFQRAHRTGGRRDPALVDPPVYWHLGNTPFERESRYRELLADPLPGRPGCRAERAVRGNWAFGAAAFLAGVTGRRTTRRTPFRAVGPGVPRLTPRKAAVRSVNGHGSCIASAARRVPRLPIQSVPIL
jgi:putative transposase